MIITPTLSFEQTTLPPLIVNETPNVKTVTSSQFVPTISQWLQPLNLQDSAGPYVMQSTEGKLDDMLIPQHDGLCSVTQ